MCVCVCVVVVVLSEAQAMRSVQRSSHAKEKRERVKSSNTVAARMKQVVEKMIMSQKEGIPHPQITVFLYKSEQSEIIASFLQEMRRENVNLFNNRAMFMDLVAARYDDIQKGDNTTAAAAGGH